MDDTTYELDLTGRLTPDLAGGDLLDAVDAASDQNHTTWLVDGGRRIARITPVDEIPDDILESGRERRTRLIARLTADGATFRRDGLAEILAAKRAETEPAWAASQLPSLNPFARDALLQVIARQVDEIHRTLGLERDDEGDLVQGDDDPLGPPWYGKRGEVAARLTSGDLIMINRDLLLQVLQDAGLVSGITDQNRYEAVWEALHALASAPVQSAARSERSEHQALISQGKFTPSGPVTIQILVDVLSLTGVQVSMGVMAAWTYSQRVEAYDWAIREHMAASDTGIARVQRPAFIIPAGGS